MNDKNDVWKDEQLRQLADVLASISDPNEIRAFLRDVMTQKEIITSRDLAVSKNFVQP